MRDPAIATRSQVIVSGSGVAVYRHNNGEPGGRYGVLHDLLPVLRAFKAAAGYHDLGYLTAHVVHRFVATHHRWLAGFVRRRKALPGFDPRDYEQQKYLGFGVEPFEEPNGVLHGDLAYVYVVRFSPPAADLVEVREPRGRFWDEPTLANTDVVRRVDFAGRVVSGVGWKQARRVTRPRPTPPPVPGVRNLEV